MITQAYVDSFENEMTKLMTELEAMPPEKAKVFAINMLDGMGLLDENKQPKKQIVTGDFFGW